LVLASRFVACGACNSGLRQYLCVCTSSCVSICPVVLANLVVVVFARDERSFADNNVAVCNVLRTPHTHTAVSTY
jgi:hypothetical protein